MTLYTFDQLEILMLVAGSEAPFQTAIQVRKRWEYVRNVATGGRADIALDQVTKDPQAWVARADAILAALDEWLHDNAGQQTGG